MRPHPGLGHRQRHGPAAGSTALAIIAREYGIPAAVVAAGHATATLRDDQHVTVNGSGGTVQLHSPHDLYDTFGSFWSVLESGGEPTFPARAALAGCFVHTLTTCREAVALLVEPVGTPRSSAARRWSATTVTSSPSGST
jgi:hypothetical protein